MLVAPATSNQQPATSQRGPQAISLLGKPLTPAEPSAEAKARMEKQLSDAEGVDLGRPAAGLSRTLSGRDRDVHTRDRGVSVRRALLPASRASLPHNAATGEGRRRLFESGGAHARQARRGRARRTAQRAEHSHEHAADQHLVPPRARALSDRQLRGSGKGLRRRSQDQSERRQPRGGYALGIHDRAPPRPRRRSETSARADHERSQGDRERFVPPAAAHVQRRAAGSRADENGGSGTRAGDDRLRRRQLALLQRPPRSGDGRVEEDSGRGRSVARVRISRG
jgi:hypothetical protein